MGAKLIKQSFETSNHHKENKSPIAMDQEEIELLSRTNLETEFNKIYLNSREKLHAITENASEDMLRNINQYFKQNSKFLDNCFNEIDNKQYEIVDLVTERLTYDEGDYKVPSTDAKDIDSYLRGNTVYEKQQKQQTQKQ
ncbi:hypothetical protein FF38_12852 [Lucilia cuprina]|uniref:Uncharacterized protein n=1 Tax=Lucilia cuprina TaxID=7375 RepID=A0A0L0BUY1_LUCCU|nr:hypothetical protein CVS40_2102 [Lucilia cuprina]KNC23836.1 hypothetical protein FF38_12852 [Lucilia cuprina]